MQIYPGSEAYSNLRHNIGKAQARIPRKWEMPFSRNNGASIFPTINPGFQMRRGDKIFTIGSCFARNIEEVLVVHGFNVPVKAFTLAGPEIALPPNHILNEYNAGTTMQRIESVCDLFEYTDEMGIEETDKGFLDLFLHVLTLPTSYDRLIERRREIQTLYKEMLSSDVVILTMGLIEAWYDNTFNCYLNKTPSNMLIRADESRFSFHRFELDDVVKRMSRGIEVALEFGVKNILLTVSPVPLETTFTRDGSVLANSYSKAVLRVAADILSKKYPQVDYFPSYEIVTSFGTGGYVEDNVHVKEDVVEQVVDYMAECYINSSN
ncbi:GSCFA domain-containing protein [Rhizobium sp.]|uniref:GSCFA domain-containing protein n=1 Tax=Rhizobium sp. TaxID=391 RepID=UPI002F090A11